MKEYKYNIKLAIVVVVVTIMFMAIIYQYINIYYNLILPSVLMIVALYIIIKGYIKNKIIVNEKKIILIDIFNFDIVEKSISWEDITIIKYEESSIIIKIINIGNRYKKIAFGITMYKNHKELLNTIIEKTKDNEKIHIDQKVIDLLK